LAPAERLGRVPLTFLEDIFGGFGGSLEGTVDDLTEVRSLRQRNQELETALAAFQSELAELREIRSDYERLSALLDYETQTSSDWRFVTADVIGRDTAGAVRILHLNRGSRDGVAIGDPVVTELGLVGRVINISATGSEVLLITDQNSSVNARLQSSRDVGLVQGTLSGDLVLTFISPDADVIVNDLVMTSGETQAFPADLVIGQVTGVSLSADELFQQAALRSLVDFSRLEFVLIITNWEPVDLSVFENDGAQQ
jgi:rod shape-determining protein MreC